jgi:hypothetical protein
MIPPGINNAGISKRAMAIKCAGTDLSQLVIKTPASKGVALT